jgi:hypothetical protein
MAEIKGPGLSLPEAGLTHIDLRTSGSHIYLDWVIGVQVLLKMIF